MFPKMLFHVWVDGGVRGERRCCGILIIMRMVITLVEFWGRKRDGYVWLLVLGLACKFLK